LDCQAGKANQFTWESEGSAMRGFQKQAEKRGLPVHFLSFTVDGNESRPDDE
jgi:hypothetical protein